MNSTRVYSIYDYKRNRHRPVIHFLSVCRWKPEWSGCLNKTQNVLSSSFDNTFFQAMSVYV